MSSYCGRHAELYDLFYFDKPYQKEAQFVNQCITKYGFKKSKRILEIACGTGSHAFALEKYGYTIKAVDYSEDMIKQAKIKARYHSSKIDFNVHDMRFLPSFDNPFDAAICLFDSIGYALYNDRIINVLKGVKKNLLKGGLFIFEFWHAAAMIKHFEPVRVKRFCKQDSEIIRISETSIDHAKQLCVVDYSIVEYRGNETCLYTKETQRNRFFLLQEMMLILSVSGFKLLKYFQGYSKNEIIDENTWHVVAIAQNV